MVHLGIKSVAEVVAERRNVVEEKYTARGASSRRFLPKIGEMTFFCGRCNTGGRFRLGSSPGFGLRRRNETK